MRFRPRTACRFHFIALVALAFALLSTSAWAQRQQRGRAPRTSPAPNKNAERAKLTPSLTLLIETADKARLCDDLFYRARVQALAADALWPHDERQARNIFRRAWEAATAADKATPEDSLSKELGETDSFARESLLEKVAARDAKLANEFLKDIS